MDLDDQSSFREIDVGNMLAHIDALPDQFENAWRLSRTLPLPVSHQHPRQIVLCGMGGSAIGGDLTAALVAATSPAAITVVRGYDLPTYACGPDTLFVASSHSGNTEETLAAIEQAVDSGMQMLAITTGGELANHAQAHGYPLWHFEYKSQPRAALGWSFGLLIGLSDRLGLAPALAANLTEAVALLRAERDRYTAASPLAQNPAKRTAGQLVGRIPVIFGSGVFEPVARRWKCQLNENAKVWAQYETMPEANHNTIVGTEFPAEVMTKMAAVFITSSLDHPRVQLRYDLTFKMYLANAIMADTFVPRGDSALAQMAHTILFGDYVSFYTAMAYGADPTTIAPITELKEQMAQQ